MGTNTGTSASALTADGGVTGVGFGGPGASGSIGVGCQVMITSGARDGDISQLSSNPKLTTGVMNVDPAFGGALSANDTFVILEKPLGFEREPFSLLNQYDKMMRWFPWEKRIVPVTGLVTDGDMLADVDTDWTESNATDAKTAASFPLGRRTLRVTATSTAGYVGTANIPVEPSTSYYLEAMGMIASTGDTADAGTLILREVQTSAGNFTLSESAISHFDPDVLANNVSMNSTTELVTIRLQADANGDIIDWGHVIFYKNGQQRFVLPDRPQRVLRIGELRVAPTAQPETRSWDRMTQIGYTAEQSDAGIWVLNLDRGLSGQAAYYEEFVQPALFTSDAATTAIPVEELGAVTAEALLRPLQRDPKWAARYQVAAYDAAVVRMKYQDANNVVVERGQQVVQRSYV